jgi:wyosine [tRNA(Phe)-imidazoG37] synthetase (radical SAM superfamily)
MNIIFGPVHSRRFGKSLGVDLSPNKKQCNFDCLYCELEAARVMDHYDDVVALDRVIDTIKTALKRYQDINFITLTANGEPTLYPYLGALIEAIDGFKGSVQTLILSNATTIMHSSMQSILSRIDVVKLSLDCVTQRCLKKLDRAHKGISVESIMQGMLTFQKQYRGELIIEILFVKGINDKDIEQYSQFLLQLNPKRIDIGTVDRPPAYKVEALSYEELFELAKEFDTTLPIYIASRKKIETQPSYYSVQEILNTLDKRPLTQEDIEILFDEKSQEELLKLLDRKKIEKVEKNGIFFYKIPKIT